MKLDDVGLARRASEEAWVKGGLGVARAVELAIWTIVENVWFMKDVWFPLGIDEMQKEGLGEVEARIRVAAGDANTEIWRACTASLLGRVGRDVKEDEVKRVWDVVVTVVRMVTGKGVPYFWGRGLKGFLEEALGVAVEMRCGKAFYELDERVKLGDAVGQGVMEVVEGGGEEEEEDLVVVAIVSRGVVERRWRGEEGKGDLVVKTRILVGRRQKVEKVGDVIRLGFQGQ